MGVTSSSRGTLRFGRMLAVVVLALGWPSNGASRASGAGARERASRAMPGPARGVVKEGRAELNRECIECHPEAAVQWQGSLHQRSFVDEDFAHAFAREPQPFCQGCHAPEADPGVPPPEEAAALGVACVTCHVPSGATLPAGGVLASPGEGLDARAPHPVVRREAFAGAAACGSCHEFRSLRSPALMMQTTLTEHRASPLAERSCQSCHMPTDAEGHRGHGFPASRDPDLLRAALEVTAIREGEAVVVSLVPRAVGHAFPTGDLFRRVVVELGVASRGAFVSLDDRVLTRRFADRPGRGRVEVADERPGMPGSPSVVRLRAPGHDREPLLWRVAYERADVHRGDRDPELFDRVILAEGVLAPHPPP